MRVRMTARRALGTASAIALCAAPAAAQTPDPATPPAAPVPASPAAATAERSQGVTALAVDAGPDVAGLSGDALMEAIAREAQVYVTRATDASGPRLVVRGEGANGLHLSFIDANGRTVDRAIVLPEDTASRRLDTAALVAASLLEDEASGLLAALRASARPAVVPPPPPKVEPPPRKVQPADPCLAPPEGARRIGADLFPGAGTSAFEPPGTVRSLSLEFIGGRFEGVSGVEVSPLLAFGGRFVCGVQVAGLGGVVGGPVHGVAAAGLFQRTGDVVRGASLAGGFVWSDSVTGGQAAGGVTFAEDLRGIQAAGASTIVRRRAEGAQLAGGVAWATEMQGFQSAGLASVTVGQMRGLQLSPVSFASSVAGAQIGVLNVAGPVQGVQIGVVNVARTSDASIGLVSIVTEGRTNLQTFATSDAIVSAALQHGGRWVHNFYGGSVSLAGDAGTAFGPMFGIGVHLPVAPVLDVDIDALGHLLFDGKQSGRPQSLWQARLVAILRLAPGFAPFIGPTYQGSIIPSGQVPSMHQGFGLRVTGESQGAAFSAWPGIVAGIRWL